jgi:16S rRNA (adenine1518-N6/adenine1519-N6)-dimethyltransferase
MHPSRSRGQNFLVDANILRIISDAAELRPLDTVIEVGAGLGALTQALLEQAGRVYAIESDSRLVRILQRELGEARNLVLVEADAARFDLESLWDDAPPGDVKMVSNLPYQIAARLVVDYLRSYPWLGRMTVMVQREVAERLAASPGGRDYSQASVKVQARASVDMVAGVSRNSFLPRPRVDSTILDIIRLTGEQAMLSEALAVVFDDVVTSAFAQRRKKLANSLSAGGSPLATREQVRAALETIGKAQDSRAEELSPNEFAQLVEVLAERRALEDA